MVFIIIFQFYLLKSIKNTKNIEKNEHNIKQNNKKVELTEEQRKKQEKMREHFENLMGFDYEKALKSSKVE